MCTDYCRMYILRVPLGLSLSSRSLAVCLLVYKRLLGEVGMQERKEGRSGVVNHLANSSAILQLH